MPEAPVEVPTLSANDKEAAVLEYVRKQELRAQKTLEKRKRAFVERLESQNEVQVQVAARLLRIKQLRAEIQERRDGVKKLKQEVRGLKPKRTRVSGAADANASTT